MNVVFFPSPPNRTYQVEICNHRLGKKMTHTEDTDSIRESNWILPMISQYGIKYSAFVLPEPREDWDLLHQYVNQNKLWLDIYMWTPNSPGSTGGIIPKEMYEEYRDKYLDFFKTEFNFRPVAYSYSYGNPSYRPYVGKDFLGARCSGSSNKTDYGVGLGYPNNVPYGTELYSEYPPEHGQYGDYLFRYSTARWWDEAIVKYGSNPTLAQFKSYIDEEVVPTIDRTLLDGGWFNNFIHIYQIDDGSVSQEAMEYYLSVLAQKNANDEIYFAGYGEAVAYLVYRQMIKRGVMYSPSNNPQNELIIRLETDNSQLQVNTDLLVIPISVKFSTVGTPLEGQTIKSDRNLISLGNNQYIIEIPWSRFPIARIEKQ